MFCTGPALTFDTLAILPPKQTFLGRYTMLAPSESLPGRVAIPFQEAISRSGDNVVRRRWANELYFAYRESCLLHY